MKSKSDATLFYKKPPATPNFCKRKVSRMIHIQAPALVAVMISYLGLSMKKHLTENV